MVYTLESVITLDEDFSHEFKGHRNLCMDDMPNFVLDDPSGRPSRQPLSKAICSFLNSIRGGVVYCGITDAGLVKGLCMVQSQREHFEASLFDLLSRRFIPPVPSTRYAVEFVPVVDDENSPVPLDPRCPEINHQLFIKSLCDCDKYAQYLLDDNKVLPKFVIEIHIKPPHENELNAKRQEETIRSIENCTLTAWPYYEHPTIFARDDGNAYIRHHAEDRVLDQSAIVQIQVERSGQFYQPIIDFYHTISDEHKSKLPVNNSRTR